MYWCCVKTEQTILLNIRYTKRWLPFKKGSNNFLVSDQCKIKADIVSFLYFCNFSTHVRWCVLVIDWGPLIMSLIWVNRPDVANCYDTVDRRYWSDIWRVRCLLDWPTKPTSTDPWLQVPLCFVSNLQTNLILRLATSIDRRLFVLVLLFVNPRIFTSTIQWWSNHMTCSCWSVAFSLISPSCNAQYVTTVNYPLPYMDCRLQLVQLVIICNWGICGMMVNVI